jgi:hypothetical protein
MYINHEGLYVKSRSNNSFGVVDLQSKTIWSSALPGETISIRRYYVALYLLPFIDLYPNDTGEGQKKPRNL